jgi:hypothetical protein
MEPTPEADDETATTKDSPALEPRPAKSPRHHRRHRDERTWHQGLYSPHAGMVTLGSDILREWSIPQGGGSGMEGYSLYEFESFTFLQEIIPNLFLGRYVLL